MKPTNNDKSVPDYRTMCFTYRKIYVRIKILVHLAANCPINVLFCYILISQGKAGDYCYGTCNHHGRCTASLHSSYGYYHGLLPAPTPPPYSTPAYTVYYPGVQTVTGASDPYPASCPMTCSQYPTLDCYMRCNDECCESREGKRKWKTNAIEAMMKERFGKQSHLTTDEERKETKLTPSDLEDKVVDSQRNNTETHNEAEDSTNVIEILQKKIKSLQRRLKKENEPHKLNFLDKINDSPEPKDDHVGIPSTKTELLSDDNKDNELETTTHDLIDDEQEPGGVHEDDTYRGPKLTDSNTTKNENTYSQEDGIGHQEEHIGNREDSVANQENSISNQGESIANQLDSIGNQENNIGNRSTRKGEKREKGEKVNKNVSINIYEPGNRMIEESLDDEREGEGSESEQLGERELFNLEDSAIDPTEEILDEEGIDDVGKFGRKRNVIHKKNKSR